MIGQVCLNTKQIRSTESVALAQFERAIRAIQEEHGFAVADYMDMSGPMVV